MVEEIRTKGRQPDYKSDGVAVWVHQDKNGNPYLSIKQVGHEYVKAFKNIPKEEKDTKVQETNMADLI